jgi:hypothetical protein
MVMETRAETVNEKTFADTVGGGVLSVGRANWFSVESAGKKSTGPGLDVTNFSVCRSDQTVNLQLSLLLLASFR